MQIENWFYEIYGGAAQARKFFRIHFVAEMRKHQNYAVQDVIFAGIFFFFPVYFLATLIAYSLEVITLAVMVGILSGVTVGCVVLFVLTTWWNRHSVRRSIDTIFAAYPELRGGLQKSAALAWIDADMAEWVGDDRETEMGTLHYSRAIGMM